MKIITYNNNKESKTSGINVCVCVCVWQVGWRKKKQKRVIRKDKGKNWL